MVACFSWQKSALFSNLQSLLGANGTVLNLSPVLMYPNDPCIACFFPSAREQVQLM